MATRPGGAHVARDPEIRAEVLARTFAAAPPFVYTDVDRGHWVWVAPAIERPRWPEHELAAEQLFERAMTGSPLVDGLRDRFMRRVVFGLEELREKLVVWNANLDDAVVEALKIQVIAERPELSRATLVVDAVVDGALEVVDGMHRLVVPRTLVARFGDDDRLPARFPELFGGRYVAIYRLLGPRYRWAEPR